jgi:hypothetical protein
MGIFENGNKIVKRGIRIIAVSYFTPIRQYKRINKFLHVSIQKITKSYRLVLSSPLTSQINSKKYREVVRNFAEKNSGIVVGLLYISNKVINTCGGRNGTSSGFTNYLKTSIGKEVVNV